MYDRDKLIGIVGKYVDNCLICGDEENMKFLKEFSELRHAFKLGVNEFTMCRIDYLVTL